MSKVIIGHVSVILFMPFTSEKQLSQCPESPHWELSTPISYWMKTVTIQKRQEMNVLEVYVGQGALLSWPGWPPKYQRLHHLWLFNLGEFFYMMLCFPSGRKKKKKKEKSRQPTAYITSTMSFPSWKCFCPHSQVEKLSGLHTEAIFIIWLLFWAVHSTITRSSIQRQSQITQENITTEVKGMSTF